MKNSYLGSSYKKDQIEKILKACNATYHEYEENELINKTSELLADGHVVGWFNGKMEFGPRALGNRSILADPRNIEMQKSLNLKIKYRESFRPFAPVIKAEKASDWFDIQTESPYMLFTYKVLNKHTYQNANKKKAKSSQPLSTNDLLHQRSKIAAVTHLDYSARVQTISKNENSRFWKLIDAFEKVTDKDAAIYRRKLAREEGIFAGNSCGAAIKGMLQLKAHFGPDDVVVVLLHDSGSRYVTKIYNDDWMREKGFLE